MKTSNNQKPEKIQSWPAAVKETHWKQFIAQTEIQEQEMIVLMRGLISEQEADILKRLDSFTKMLETGMRNKFSPTSLFGNQRAENSKWEKVLRPFIAKLVVGAGNKSLEELGITNRFDAGATEVNKYLDGLGLSFIKEVNETTRKQVIKSVTEGLQENESPVQISKRINEIYEALRGYRSERIARTSVIQSNNFGTEEGYAQSGIVEGKEWLAALDERTRHTHAEADGQIKELGESFLVGGENLEYPGDPSGSAGNIVNCRCTIIPVLTPIRSIRIAEEKAKKQKQEEKIEEIYHNLARKMLEKELSDLAQEKLKTEEAIKQIQDTKHKIKEKAVEEVQEYLDDKKDVARKKIEDLQLEDSAIVQGELAKAEKKIKEKERIVMEKAKEARKVEKAKKKKEREAKQEAEKIVKEAQKEADNIIKRGEEKVKSTLKSWRDKYREARSKGNKK
jgi:SPP1 gp7 family putative phage head morphogenesis protein